MAVLIFRQCLPMVLPSFQEVVNAIINLWQTDRASITQAADKLSAFLAAKSEQISTSTDFNDKSIAQAADRLIENYDWKFGGWGSAPKFPQPMALEFLLRRAKEGDEKTLNLVIHALNAMAKGGMFDILGGGFSRYATDEDWLVPHFEKMLYDNAQLATVYLHAWQITQKPLFRQVVEQTLNFILREMRSPEGGFYASLDADSEGEEGKYYIWTLKEVRDVLGGKNDLFEAAYGINEKGNWEGKIILHRVMSDHDLAKRFSLSEDEVTRQLEMARSQLLERRNHRIRPGTDDKILTFWNGLMLSAFAEAARVFKNGEYLQVAQQNADFLLSNLWRDGRLRRAWRDGQVSQFGFLEDYGALILGLLDLYQTDFNNKWYLAAAKLTEEMIARFNDPRGGFFDTPEEETPVLLRPKNIQDSATPSGNAQAVEVLLKMAAFAENQGWRTLAVKTLRQTAHLAVENPLSFGRWLIAADFYVHPTRQIALIGNPTSGNGKVILRMIGRNFLPNTVLAASDLPLQPGSPELLMDRPEIGNEMTVYVCEGFVCQRPVTNITELKKQLGW